MHQCLTVEITVRGIGCRQDRIETAVGEITDQTTPARHGHSICGLPTRTAIAAHTLHRITPTHEPTQRA